MKSVIIFLSGVAVGALGTALWTVKKLVPDLREEAARKAQEEAREIPDYSQYLTDDDEAEERDEDKEDDIPSPPPSEVKKAVQENRETSAVDYSRYSDKPGESEKKSEKKPEEKPVEEKAKKSRKPEPEVEPGDNGPYVIDVSEFDIRGDYKTHSYTIYANGIIVDDDRNQVVTFNPEKVFGKTAMDELQKEGIVHVRDEARKREYRIEMYDFDYEGPDPEDEDYDWGQ